MDLTLTAVTGAVLVVAAIGIFVAMLPSTQKESRTSGSKILVAIESGRVAGVSGVPKGLVVEFLEIDRLRGSSNAATWSALSPDAQEYLRVYDPVLASRLNQSITTPGRISEKHGEEGLAPNS